MRTAIRANWLSMACSLTRFWVLEEMERFCSPACVVRKPRIFKLTEVIGNNTLARKNTLRASGLKALNRWSCSHIGGGNFKQAVLNQSVQQLREIRAQQLRFHVVLVQELLIRDFDFRRCRH
jgi:hypothetical protein